MAQPRQKIMKVLGESGCYFLSLVELAEEITQSRIDAVDVYEKATKNGWMDDEATMMYPASVLSFMTGLKFSMEKQSPDYVTDETQYEILVFRNGNYTHFVLGNGKGGVKYDPLGNSNTVRNGAIVGKRIFSLI